MSCYINSIGKTFYRTFDVVKNMTFPVRIFSLILVFLARFVLSFLLQDGQDIHSSADAFHKQKNEVSVACEFCCNDENETESESDDESENHFTPSLELQEHLASLHASNEYQYAHTHSLSVKEENRFLLFHNLRL
jgi:hypothetical protein